MQHERLNASLLKALPETKRNEALAAISDAEKAALRYSWPFFARDAQLLPDTDDWHTWLILAGRGFGKTRTGAETVRWLVEYGGYQRVALIARTAADARDVMVEGESGMLNIYPLWQRPAYEPSKRRITFANGAIATTYSSDKPDQLRGPQHDLIWADELAAWRYPQAWDQALFGLRLGDAPRAIVTTTPRPTHVIRALMDDDNTILTRGTTYDNIANLAPSAVAYLRSRYEGTRLGRQELNAEILDDVPGAVWTRAAIDAGRVARPPELSRIVVAVDPAVTAGEGSDETGVVVVALGADGHGYVLDDASGRYSPLEWARVVSRLYRDYEADRVIAEVNNGGDLVEAVLRQVDERIAYKQMRASRGKAVRAEPVAALYEQGRVHHVAALPELEDQLCTWVPGESSPDRLDALVWGLSELMVTDKGPVTITGNFWGR